MGDTISPVHQLERLSDYQRFFHTKTYIKSKSLFYADEKKLMDVCHYRDRSKFYFDQKQWDDLEKPVPTRYLREIGVDFKTLQFTVELDCEEYKKALDLPFFPKQGFVRYRSSSYAVFNFLEGTSEEQAIELLKELSTKEQVLSLINVRGLKTIFVQPDGLAFTKYYTPTVEIFHDCVVASKAGRDLEIL